MSEDRLRPTLWADDVPRGQKALETRLTDKYVARLIKQTVLSAGIRSDLPEKARLALFSGHSLRAGLASLADVDWRYVQKQLGIPRRNNPPLPAPPGSLPREPDQGRWLAYSEVPEVVEGTQGLSES